MKSFFPSIFHRDDPRTALHSRLDNVFDDFAKDWLSTFPNAKLDKQQIFPALDVKECGEYFEVKAELPDMNDKDIEVEVQGNYLNIRGEKKYEKDTDEKGYHVRERSFGSFYRQVPLGFHANAQDITANYSKGVLAIHIPKPAELQHETQKIKVAYKD